MRGREIDIKILYYRMLKVNCTSAQGVFVCVERARVCMCVCSQSRLKAWDSVVTVVYWAIKVDRSDGSFTL